MQRLTLVLKRQQATHTTPLHHRLCTVMKRAPTTSSGIPWGYRTNAEEIRAYLREQCALVAGPTGSGKTNMVHGIPAGFARAEDILTWSEAGRAAPGCPRTRHARSQHFYASVLLDAGENIKALSHYLEHNDPGFTLRVYTQRESEQRCTGSEGRGNLYSGLLTRHRTAARRHGANGHIGPMD